MKFAVFECKKKSIHLSTGYDAFDKNGWKHLGYTTSVVRRSGRYGRSDRTVRFKENIRTLEAGGGGVANLRLVENDEKKLRDRGSPVLKRADGRGYGIETGGPFLRPFNL